MADVRSLVDQIAELEARGREALARAARMREVQDRYENDIRRLASGTEDVADALPEAPVPSAAPAPARPGRAARARKTTAPAAAAAASTPAAAPAAPAALPAALPAAPATPEPAVPRTKLRSIPDSVPGTLYTRIRTELSTGRALTARQLAQVLEIDGATVEASLGDLRRAGQVYRFEDDDAYIWCIGDVTGEERRLFVEMLLNTRHITRAEIIAAIGHPPGDRRPHKEAVKDADNALNQLRMTLGVHAEVNVRGVSVYWLMRREDGKYQNPPAKQDGRLKRPPRKAMWLVMHHFLTAMLDEIERLRSVLCLEHSSACAILRAGAACTCGAAARTIAMLSETHSLRAQLVQARGLAECAQREIMRLDLRVLELRVRDRAAVAALPALPAPGPAARAPASAPKARGSSPYMRAVTPDGAYASDNGHKVHATLHATSFSRAAVAGDAEAPSDADGFKMSNASMA